MNITFELNKYDILIKKSSPIQMLEQGLLVDVYVVTGMGAYEKLKGRISIGDYVIPYNDSKLKTLGTQYAIIRQENIAMIGKVKE